MKLRRTGAVYKSRKEIVREFIEFVLASSTAECIYWPFGVNKDLRNGYSYFMVDGKTQRAHRYVCMRAHGNPPTTRHHAAHECNNRKCVNPRHLSWKTPKANADDKIRHGTKLIGESTAAAKLTEKDVLQIRRLASHTKHKELAKMFSVSLPNVEAIIGRRIWKHI